MAACVPMEFGGLGVESVHDYMLGINRLDRGDASTAIAANMQIFPMWTMRRTWQAARVAGDESTAAGVESVMRQFGVGEVVICGGITEPGTDLLHPLAEATAVEGGFALNSRKIFGAMSPAAHRVLVSFRCTDANGADRRANTFVARDTPGLEIKDNWDARGMRASGSNDITFRNCFIPAAAVRDSGPWGEYSAATWVGVNVASVGLVGAFLGVAETAQRLIIDLVRTRRKAPSGGTLAQRPGIQHGIAESEIELAAAKAVLARTALAADEYFSRYAAGSEPLDELHQWVKDFQCAKRVVTAGAIAIADRAMTPSGGSGYMSSSPLSRLYRDVRAGPFMQPFSPNEVHEYIGKVTLGLAPTLEA